MLLASQGGPWAQVRMGTVTAATTNSVLIDIGGSTIKAAFLRGTEVAVGDLVAVLRQDATWILLGALAGIGGNEVQNPSFETGDLTSWNQFETAGLSTFTVSGPSDEAPDGDFFYSATTAAAAGSTSMLYSAPIPVVTGDQFSLSAYVWGRYVGDAAQDADAALLALWFANETNLYPTTSSADIVVASLNDVPSLPPYSSLSGTVTAPVTGYMRVGLRSIISTTGSLHWDLITARRI